MCVELVGSEGADEEGEKSCLLEIYRAVAIARLGTPCSFCEALGVKDWGMDVTTSHEGVGFGSTYTRLMKFGSREQ